jgi:hypothetical protein
MGQYYHYRHGSEVVVYTLRMDPKTQEYLNKLSLECERTRCDIIRMLIRKEFASRHPDEIQNNVDI